MNALIMEKDKIREPAVAGVFYSSDKNELKKSIENFLKSETCVLDSSELIRALIVPHAGYVYSGEVAASAYAQLGNDISYDLIVMIGSSHHHRFKGVSINRQSAYQTPLGTVEVDTELAKQLIPKSDLINYVPEAHDNEHTLEVQLPFVQMCIPGEIKILPIIVGTDNMSDLKKVANVLRFLLDRNALFVISTDLSHYPNYYDALEQDEQTVTMIVKNDPKALVEFIRHQKDKEISGLVTNLCGWTSVVLFQYLISEEEKFQFVPLKYQNSGDKLMQNHNRVVGYQSIVVVEYRDTLFSKKAENELLANARYGLYRCFNIETELNNDCDDELNVKYGAFVSVYVNDELRGCIGSFNPAYFLKQQVQKLVVDAAIFDRRFKSVEAKELPDVKIKISVLGPLQEISCMDEVQIGKHGIYLRSGLKKGTYLPEVAVHNNWDAKQFVEHCAFEKAGLTLDEFQRAELFVYDTNLISE